MQFSFVATRRSVSLPRAGTDTMILSTTVEIVATAVVNLTTVEIVATAVANLTTTVVIRRPPS